MLAFFKSLKCSGNQKQNLLFGRITGLFCIFLFFALLSTTKHLNAMPFSVFKYVDKIKICVCTRSDWSPQNFEKCYCWTFEKIEDERNFIPVYAKTEPAKQPMNCGGFGLSFYNNKQYAIDKLKDFGNRKPQLIKITGTHVATGKVTTVHGECDTIDTKGHFNLLEYIGADLRDSFEVGERIIDG